MAKFCLLPHQVESLNKGLESKEITSEKLFSMSPEDRHAFLGEVLGKDNAKNANALFEKELILKSQKKGMEKWINELKGTSPIRRRDFLNKVRSLDKVMSSKQQSVYLKDLVDTKLGVDITVTQANHIADLAHKINEASALKDRLLEEGKDGAKAGFGEATIKMKKYTDSLNKGPGTFLSKVTDIVGFQRKIQTGLDVSAAARQAITYIGRKEWREAVSNGFKYMKSEAAYDQFKANMYNNKNWDVIERYKKQLGLTSLGETVYTREEAFVSRIGNNVPGLNGSERFYEGMLNDLRFNRFNNFINASQKAGKELTSDELESMAKVISAATGRGNIGNAQVERYAGAFGTALFAPKNIISKFNIVLDPLVKRGPAQKEAAQNLAILAGMMTGGIFAMKAAGVDVEVDPRSSDFGKAKIGNTHVDLTFGYGGYIRLTAQLISGSTKSGVTGGIRSLNTGEYGSTTSFDVLSSFVEGKGAPIPSLIIDLMKHKDFDGNKLGLDLKNIKDPTNLSIPLHVASMFQPLFFKDVLDAFKAASGQDTIFSKETFSNGKGLRDAALVAPLSAVGIGTNTYKSIPQSQSWDDLKSKLGPKKYTQATNTFTKTFNQSATELRKSSLFKSADTDTKSKYLNTLKTEVQKKAQASVGFYPPKQSISDRRKNTNINRSIRRFAR